MSFWLEKGTYKLKHTERPVTFCPPSSIHSILLMQIWKQPQPKRLFSIVGLTSSNHPEVYTYLNIWVSQDELPNRWIEREAIDTISSAKD